MPNAHNEINNGFCVLHIAQLLIGHSYCYSIIYGGYGYDYERLKMSQRIMNNNEECPFTHFSMEIINQKYKKKSTKIIFYSLCFISFSHLVLSEQFRFYQVIHFYVLHLQKVTLQSSLIRYHFLCNLWSSFWYSRT